MNSKLINSSNILLKKNVERVIFTGLILLLFMVGLAFSVQTAKAVSVAVVSHKSLLNSIDALYIYGEIQNLENYPIHCEKVTATYYDSSNNVITVRDWHGTTLEVLSPNQKSPFYVLLWNETKNAIQLGPKVDHYDITVTASATSQKTVDVKVVSQNANYTTGGSIIYTGEVENQGTVSANYTQIFLTCYDSTGKVVFTDYTFADDHELLPGEKSSFKIYNIERELTPLVDSYTLVAEATPYDSITDEHPSDLDIGAEVSIPPYVYAAWAPPAENAVAATAVTTIAVGVVSVAIAAGTRSAGTSAGKVAEKAQGLVPDSVKKWLEEFMCSKRKETVEVKTRSPFLPTKTEAIAYAVSLVALTLSFSYAKVPNFSLILNILPLVLITAVLVEFVKTYIVEVFARSRGVWTEHRLWYFGLAMFLITTFAFGVPFSSPSRNVYHSEKMTKRLSGMIGAVSILVTLAFAGLFFGLLVGGFALIGSTGLAMCIIIALIDTFPMTPMNGKSVFDYSKALWAALFGVTVAGYVVWLLFF